MRGRTKLVSLRTTTRWRPWELSPSAPVASSRSPSENPPVLYHAVCGSIRTQRDFPLSGYAWHQRKAFSLDEQVQRKSSTISAAQRCIAGRVGRNFKRPARLLNLYRQCLAIRTQPIDSRAFEIRSFDMIVAARNRHPETPDT